MDAMDREAPTCSGSTTSRPRRCSTASGLDRFSRSDPLVVLRSTLAKAENVPEERAMAALRRAVRLRPTPPGQANVIPDPPRDARIIELERKLGVRGGLAGQPFFGRVFWSAFPNNVCRPLLSS
jgi:hypothetical protein